MPILTTSDKAPLPVKTKPDLFISRPALRFGFWCVGIFLAAMQAWIRRYDVSADSISYLDMSDAVMPGEDWHRLVNGVWSPL
jgi:hypothetical protein